MGDGGSETPGEPPPVLTFDLLRRFVDSPYGSLNRNNLHLQQNPVPTGDGGTCGGDSGGPHFWEASLILVSVTSWGDAVCRSNDMTQQTDIPTVLDFPAEFDLTPPDRHTAAGGIGSGAGRAGHAHGSGPEGASQPVEANALRIASTERSTSSSVVVQFETEMRMRRCPCQVVPPSQQVPSR